jgi:hypothetical protein
MLRMTHPSRNFFVLSLFCVWLRVQGFESSVNKVFQKEKLVNSKTIKYTVLIKELVQKKFIWFNIQTIEI